MNLSVYVVKPACFLLVAVFHSLQAFVIYLYHESDGIMREEQLPQNVKLSIILNENITVLKLYFKLLDVVFRVGLFEL